MIKTTSKTAIDKMTMTTINQANHCASGPTTNKNATRGASWQYYYCNNYSISTIIVSLLKTEKNHDDKNNNNRDINKSATVGVRGCCCC
jgi:hypothetical protein